MFTIIGVVVAVLLLILAVAWGLKRRKEKTISFTKDADAEPKELTQQEKSGVYQAQGGFNFAPATPAGAKQPEPVPADAPKSKEPEAASVAPAAPLSPSDPASDSATGGPHHEEVAEPTPEEQPEPIQAAPASAAEPAPTAQGKDAGKSQPAADPAASRTAGEQSEPERSSETDGADPKPPQAPQAQDAARDSQEPAAPEPEARAQRDHSGQEPLREDRAAEIAAATEAAVAAQTTQDSAEQALAETPVPDTKEAPAPAPEPQEEIAPAEGRLGRLRGRLSRSNNVIGQGVLGILSAGDLDEDAWEEIEDTLIMADLGTKVTMEVVDKLREKVAARGVENEDQARAMLRETLIEAGRPELDRSIKAMPFEGKPAVVLLVGVNGTGKTTTTGKLGRVLVAMGHKVLFGAADTFRAAAADQLETWGRRVGAETVRGKEGADPASVAFDAVAKGVQDQVDVVLIDTAGRLHTSVGLMDQLGKVKRVVEKKARVDEVLLVLDATVGQNGLMQARTFRDVVDITGVVLTKLDGTAKGGIVFQVQEELGVPVKLVGLGEGADHLAPFEAESFVDALLA